MESVEYDLTLTQEQNAIRETARKFAASVLRPAGIAIDRLSPEEATAPNSPLFGVLRQASELGFSRMNGPAELGGLEAPPLVQHIVLEELAFGSAGLAAAIFLSSYPADTALGSGDPELRKEFAAPYFASGDGKRIGCWAITEPDHGSDEIAVMRPEMRVKGPGQLVARRDGDSWVLNGQKSAWVSNAPIATVGVFNAHLEPRSTLDRSGVFVVPLNLPGISRGRPLDKHGLRSLPQGQIFFEDVRLPRRYLVAQGEAYPCHVENTLTAFNAAVGALASGLARAAFSAALTYTRQRIQGGRPIFDHQAVRARLFRMFSLVRAATSLSRQVYVYNVTRLKAGEPAYIEHSIASKVFCTDAALEVATLAVQLHGGVGMTKEYPVEMFLRDAAACTIADGENSFLAQLGATTL